jgi:hypothetical protein
MHQAKMKRQGFIKNKVMIQLVVVNIDKINYIAHTNVIPPTFEGMIVMICCKCEANNILVLLTRFMPLSPNTQVAFANGHYEAIFTSIMLLFY